MTIMISSLEAPSQIQGIHGGAGAMQWKSLAPTSAMSGDWYSLEYAVLPSGVEAGLHTHTRTEELWLVTAGQASATPEVMIFVTKGQGIIHSDDTVIQLSHHQSATLPQTAVLHLEQQGDEPLEFYLIELGVAKAQL